MRALVIGVVSALALSGAATAQQQLGTAEQAKDMLSKAVAAVKADELVALAMFNKGERAGFGRVTFTHSATESATASKSPVRLPC